MTPTLIQEVALAMGIDVPLFPSQSHLICAGCGEPIEGYAEPDECGWLCENCATEED